MAILMVHRVKRKVSKLNVILVECADKVGRSFIGETEWPLVP